MSQYDNVVAEMAELSAWNFKRQQRIEELEAQLAAEVNRREEAEADAANCRMEYKQLFTRAAAICDQYNQAQAELAEERARLDWAIKHHDALLFWRPVVTREDIDAARGKP